MDCFNLRQLHNVRKANGIENISAAMLKSMSKSQDVNYQRCPAY